MDKRGKFSLQVQIGAQNKVKYKIDPGRIPLESSWARTGVEAPDQPRVSYREMQRTTVGGYRQVGGSLGQRGVSSLFKSSSG